MYEKWTWLAHVNHNAWVMLTPWRTAVTINHRRNEDGVWTWTVQVADTDGNVVGLVEGIDTIEDAKEIGLTALQAT